MTLLILGGKGMLGTALAASLPGDVIVIDMEECDLTNRNAVLQTIHDISPEVVINAAAMTDVDRCEREPESAMKINGDAAGFVAEACNFLGARLIHISTDYVFDGRKITLYRESDHANPLSAYGSSKLMAEKNVLKCSDCLIVRISWLFGHGREHFISMMAGFIREGRDLRVIDDQLGRITYAPDVAFAMSLLLEKDVKGILHFANTGTSSRFEQVKWMAEIMGRGDQTITPVPSSSFPQNARRPMRSVLDTSRYEKVTGVTPPYWQSALQGYLEREGWI